MAAAAGALLPDLSLYVLAGTALYVLAIPPSVVFDQLYFSDAWQRIFAIDNSVFVWGAILAVAWRAGSRAGMAFAGAGLLHLACDLLLHHDDGRAHFWPLTRWIFESPVSYWDSRRGAGLVAPLEFALAALAAGLLLRRFRGIATRAVILLALVAEGWAVRQWLLFF